MIAFTRRVLTQRFLKQLGIASSAKAIEQHVSKWWTNIRSNALHSYRLSAEGYRMMSEDLEYEFWTVLLPDKFDQHPSLMLFLNNHVTHPYYIDSNQMMVSNVRIAIKLIMFVDDIRTVGVERAMAIYTRANFRFLPSRLGFTKKIVGQLIVRDAQDADQRCSTDSSV